MGASSRRITGLWLLLPSLLVVAGSGMARAQATVASNPTTVAFPPSPDHWKVLADGRPAVDHYEFDVYSVGASQPFQRTNIGKPAPAADGSIYYDFSGGVMSWPLPGGNYEARVAAVGPSGSGLSSPSNPFTFTFTSCSYTLSGTSASLPAAGGGTQVSVTTGSTCTWTAVSNVSWIVLSAAGFTGNGTVVATVAANTSTSSRTGTLIVAGRTFTVSQQGGSCTYTLSSSGASIAAAGGSGSVGVGASGTNCAWTAVSAASWVSVAPASGSGGGTVYYNVGANTGSARTTTLTIAGKSYAVSQAGAATSPSQALPSPWLHLDIGSVGLAGSAAYSNGVFSVAGSGADVGGTADSFHFVYQPLTGLSTIVARLTVEQATVPMAKAGIMMREGRDGLVAGAGHAMLSVRPDGSVEFLTRSATGGTTTLVAATTQAVPAWLKLVRNSTTVTASVSSNGTTWRTIGSASLALTSKSLVGLAVTSHDQTQRNTTTFDNVTVR